MQNIKKIFDQIPREGQEILALSGISGFWGFQPENGLYMKLFFEAPEGYSVKLGSCGNFRSNVWLQQTSSAVDLVNVNDPFFEPVCKILRKYLIKFHGRARNSWPSASRPSRNA